MWWACYIANPRRCKGRSAARRRADKRTGFAPCVGAPKPGTFIRVLDPRMRRGASAGARGPAPLPRCCRIQLIDLSPKNARGSAGRNGAMTPHLAHTHWTDQLRLAYLIGNSLSRSSTAPGDHPMFRPNPHTPLRLADTVSASASMEPADTRATKAALKALGHYPPAHHGLSGPPDVRGREGLSGARGLARGRHRAAWRHHRADAQRRAL